MSIRASITYHLSERGRRDSLRRGGNGARVQVAAGAIEPELVDAFQVDEQGSVSFDATGAPTLSTTELWHSVERKWQQVVAPTKNLTIDNARYRVEWDVMPDWSALLDFVRYVNECLRDEEDALLSEAAEENAARAQVVSAFLADPSARAQKVSEDYVEINGHTIWLDRVVLEAKERWARDIDERRQANRATLARWIQEHGSQNQRERLDAGLLPWSEAHSELERHLFAALEQFAPYTRFEVSDICVCPQSGEPQCGLKFQSVDATELDADEWGRFSQIKAAVPEAQFQLREHRALCRSKNITAVKRGVIVKRSVDQLTFKREFALGGVHDVERV
jgi:hypothetical protein